MTHPIPQPGRYREIETDFAAEVLGCTGDSDFDYVSVHIPAKHQTKTYHVLLGRFWDDYEEVSG